MQVTLRVLRAVLVALAGYYALLFVLQRHLLYPAPRGEFTSSIPGDAELLTLRGEGGDTVQAWYLPADGGRSIAVALFLHGNGERAEQWLNQFRVLRGAGLGVVVVEYPGYGVAPGSPSEASLTMAALAAYDWVRQDPRLSEAPIVVHGRSLGGGVATRLAARRPVAALVLESSFTDLRAFAAGFFAPGMLVRDRFDNLSELARYRGPLLVLHGEHDEIAPFAGGRALAEAVERSQFVAMPCGHNDCSTPWPSIVAFLRDQGVVTDSAPTRDRPVMLLLRALGILEAS